MFVLIFALAATATCSVPAVPRIPTYVSRTGEANDLYSLRARKRIATYLRMRLLEMRELQLRRAADVVEKRISIDDLLAASPAPAPAQPSAAPVRGAGCASSPKPLHMAS